MSISCNVVLLPSEALSQKAVETSRMTSRYENLFTLEVGEFYPHMSLYMFQLHEVDIPNIEVLLHTIAEHTPVISAMAVAYSLGQGFSAGYVDAEYKITPRLVSLQDAVVNAINPLRAGMRESTIAKMQAAKGLKLENLQKFGYPAIGGLFRPHITFTRLKEYNPDVLDLLPNDVRTFSGVFDRIGLFEMGPSGTCVRQIATWDLT